MSCHVLTQPACTSQLAHVYISLCRIAATYRAFPSKTAFVSIMTRIFRGVASDVFSRETRMVNMEQDLSDTLPSKNWPCWMNLVGEFSLKMC